MTTIENQDLRDLHPIPEENDFYDLLYDRLYMVLDNFFLKDPFTFFLTLLDRPKEGEDPKWVPRYEKFPLANEGINAQKIFLEYQGQRYLELEPYWHHLLTTDFEIKDEEDNNSRKTVSYNLFKELRDNDFSLDDFDEEGKATGKMSDYFSILTKIERSIKLEEVEISKQRRKAEFHILDTYFDLDNYRYLSLPLIQFTEFDGIVHIVLSNSDHGLMHYEGNLQKGYNKRLIGNIIKAFSREYEGMFLDWDLVGSNKEKVTALTYALARLEAEVAEDIKLNPILGELDFLTYYRRHNHYFQKRFEYSDEIPGLLYQQSLKNAIITILIDSFAHNVSAHSLTATLLYMSPFWRFRLV